MQLFIEEYTSVFFILAVLLQKIFWHSPFKPSYLARPIIEEYFLAFLHVEKWVEELIFDPWCKILISFSYVIGTWIPLWKKLYVF